MAKRAGILVRLSEEKDTEAKTAEAFERFEAACRRRCELEGWTVVEPVFNEGIVSAYKSNRKRNTFEQAMLALETGQIDVLVVPYVDRFCRGYAEPARAEKAMNAKGGDIVDSTGRSAREDDTWHVLVGVAIAESKRISRRVKAQAAQAAAKGRPHGGARAFGFEGAIRDEHGNIINKDRVGVVHVESEADVIKDATRRLLKGEEMGAVVRDLRKQKVKGPRGALLTTTTLRLTLCNPRIANIRVHRGEEVWKDGKPVKVKGGTEIISEADFRKVRGIFTGRARQEKGTKPGAGRKYAYSGLLKCSLCDGGLFGSSGAYVCSCRRTYLTAKPFERVMDEAVIKWVSGPVARERFARLLEALRQNDSTMDNLESDRAELADIENTPERFRARIDPGGHRQAELAGKVRAAEARLAAQPALEVLAATPMVEQELRAAWAGWSIEERRARLAAVLESVTIKPSTRRGGVFDDSRIEPHWR